MRHQSYIIYYLVILIFSFSSLLGSVATYAINAAPSIAAFPKYLLSLSDETLLKKALDYHQNNQLDSALLYYVVVAQRDINTSSEESLKQGLSARLNAGNLYYFPFYDYGKAYSFFQDVYDIASKHHNYEYMGLAANCIGNVLSIYESSYPGEREGEIVNWYGQSADYLMRANNISLSTLPVNNLIAMSFDTAILRKAVPTLLKFYDLPIVDSIPLQSFTKEHVLGYLKINEGKYDEAASIFYNMLKNKDASIDPGKNIEVDAAEVKIQLFFDLASLYSLTNRYDSAIYYAKEVQKLAEKYGLYEVVPGACLMEADLYGEMGKPDLRKDALLRYYITKDSLLTLSTISLYSEPHLKKRIFDIDVQLVKEIDAKRLRNIVIVFVSLLVLILAVFAVVVIRKNKTLSRKNEHLLEKLEVVEQQEKITLQNTINELKRGRKSSLTTDEEKSGNLELLSKIVDIMEHSEVIYEPDFSIDTLARLCDEKTKVVSAELNSSFSKNFNTLLNEYRIREMCRYLDNPDYTSFTIEAIAQKVGFKARSTYIAAFKKYTGLTPSEYLKTKAKMTKEKDKIAKNLE